MVWGWVIVRVEVELGVREELGYRVLCGGQVLGCKVWIVRFRVFYGVNSMVDEGCNKWVGWKGGCEERRVLQNLKDRENDVSLRK